MYKRQRVDCVVVDSLPAQKLVEANADKMMILPFAASDTKEAYAIGLPMVRVPLDS